MGAVAVVSDFQSAEEAEFIDDLGSKSTSQVEGAKLLELFESYARDMEVLKQMAAVMSAPDARSVVKYFEHASYCERVGYSRVDMSIFDYDAGKSALDALHWERALNMTNLLELMPQNRRSEWNDTIRQRKTLSSPVKRFCRPSGTSSPTPSSTLLNVWMVCSGRCPETT